jgi:hypothetical protein
MKNAFILMKKTAVKCDTAKMFFQYTQSSVNDMLSSHVRFNQYLIIFLQQ